MLVKCEDYSHVCVMELQGDFTADTGAAVRKSLEEYVEQRHIHEFIIDFKKTGFVDSDGLETILWMKRRCEDMFGKVKLVNLDGNCLKILEITRLAHQFECQSDLAMALKTMR